MKGLGWSYSAEGWTTANNSTSTNYENLLSVMERINALMPKPAFERAIMLQSHYEALKKAVPQDVSSVSPSLQYGFLGMPIEVYPTREECAKRAEELAEDGVRVMLCVDGDDRSQCFGDSVSPDGEA